MKRRSGSEALAMRNLREAGWRVVRIWECDLARKHWPRVARRVLRALAVGRQRVEF